MYIEACLDCRDIMAGDPKDSHAIRKEDKEYPPVEPKFKCFFCEQLAPCLYPVRRYHIKTLLDNYKELKC